MSAGHQANAVQADGRTSTVHASCVAHGERAVLILGASGRGKSGLALQLMSLGAQLVADDRTCLGLSDGPHGPCLIADAPASLRGLIEARGIGILNAQSAGPVSVELVVDLDQSEKARLPALRRISLLGVDLPLVHMVDSPAFPASILQYLRFGRHA